MNECKFCLGKPINSYSVGNGIKTMSEMISSFMFIVDSTLGRKDDEETKLSNGIMLVDGNKMHVDNSAREYDPVEIEINYCPMCGRKLVD